MIRDILIFLLFIPFFGKAETFTDSFENISPNEGLADPTVYCFAQDHAGFLYVGTKDGLNRYDGYRFTTFTHIEGDSLSLSHSRITCLLNVGDSLYVGTDKGVNIYNRHTNSFSTIPSTEAYAIKFAEQETPERIWFGTNYGIILYENGHCIHYSRQKGDRLFIGDYVPCGFVASDGHFYAGTHQYLCKLQTDQSFENIPLPFNSKLTNNLLLSIIEDTEHPGQLWLGTEQGLIHYSPQNAELHLEAIPVKTLHYDENQNLWIGTDNGLYIKPFKSNTFVHKKHATDNSYAIASNVIWNIFNDRENNLWLGTDNGISIKPAKRNFNTMTIKEITGSNEGNQLFTIYRDSRNNLWLGGSNGLIRYNLKTGVHKWFKADNKQLSHNKVRNLYEDPSSLWIATDGGLNRYDYATQQINHYTLIERSGLYNANWMYSIMEDRYGYLWLGTYEGGIFVVEKRKLLESKDKHIIADNHFNNKTATFTLSSNIINTLQMDSTGCVWACTDNSGINVIDMVHRQLHLLTDNNNGLNSNFIRCLAIDHDEIWVGTNSGLNRLLPPYQKAENVVPAEINTPIRFIATQDSNVWFATNVGIACYNKHSHNLNNIHFDNIYSTCLHYYQPSRQMYIGTTNGFIEFTPDSLLSHKSIPSLKITNLYIDNQLVKINESIHGRVLVNDAFDELKEIELNNTENSFGLEFSAFSEQKGSLCYAYRLKGFEDDWQPLEGVSNRASYTNIPSGSYIFEIQTLNSNRQPMGNITSLHITVLPPWFRSWWAYSLYLFMAAFVTGWIIYGYNRKHRRERERFERDKTLTLTRMKLDFFANISHEFKTPLSLIIGYIGRLTLHESNNEQKRQLTVIQQNAEKLHALINQMLDYKEEKESDSLICSETALDDFARNVFDQFAEAMANKHITGDFHADELTAPFSIDRVKMESVLTNLLSNALKFTPEGGKISLNIQRTFEDDKELEIHINVTDNGCGIASDDLPKVFDRYFVSATSQHLNKEGTGIGLSLAKRIVEQHGGNISIDSDTKEGTTVTVTLRTQKRLQAIGQLNVAEKLDFRPTILVVEDNAELQEFITSSLKEHFDIHTANNGKEGYEKALECRPNLIITDLMMPLADGFQLCKSLKENIHTATLPIIILTAKNDRETEMRSYEYADAFIAKPFELNYLYNLIVKLILKSQKIAEKSRQKEIATPKAEDIVSPDELFLKQITDLVEDSLSDPDLNVTLLCQKCGLNDKQVYRKIKQLTGMSVVEYIRNIRLKKAAMYLRQNKLSVSEIMYLVGFSNASYFTKCFKEEYGMSPKEFIVKNTTSN